MIVQFTISFLIPAILTILLTPLVIRLSKKIGAVDKPGGRKIHKSVTPRLGGVAVFTSIWLSTILIYLIFPELFEGMREYTLQVLILSICLVSVFILGFRDDLKSLKPGTKFGIQILIASLVYFAGFKISNITNPLGGDMLNVEIIDFPLTLLWIVGITNAFNLIDGLDGLASGVAAIASLSIFSISLLENEIWSAVLAIILAGSLAGFLRYNFNPAKIFLGDSGSLVIGFCLALMSIQSTTKISTGFALLFPMLVLILPITDTLISMARRFLVNYLPEKKSGKKRSFRQTLHGMFTPDSSHIHHQLISLGLTHRNAVLLLYVVSGFFAAGALIFTQIDSPKKSIAAFLIFGFALITGVRKLKYHEISILNNGLMLPIYERWILNRTIFLSLIDLCFIVVSLSLSYLLSGVGDSLVDLPNPDHILVLLLSVQLSVFWLTGLYREKIRSLGIGNALSVTATVGYATGGACLLLIVMDVLPVGQMLQFLVFDFYFLLTFTLGLRIAYQALSFWFNRNKTSGEIVLIYGANENGTMILHKINNSPSSKFRVIGFLDDNPELEGKLIYGYPILGGHWKLAKTLLSKKVDSIFICEQSIKPENLKRLKSLAEEKNIKVKRLHIQLKSIETASGEINRSSTSKKGHTVTSDEII